MIPTLQECEFTNHTSPQNFEKIWQTLVFLNNRNILDI